MAQEAEAKAEGGGEAQEPPEEKRGVVEVEKPRSFELSSNDQEDKSEKGAVYQLTEFFSPGNISRRARQAGQRVVEWSQNKWADRSEANKILKNSWKDMVLASPDAPQKKCLEDQM